MVDMGSGPLQCSCPDSGGPVERIALFSAGSSIISASFFFAKNTPSGATQITNLIGVENDANTSNVTVASTTQFPYGIPIMDDSPRQNETWNDGAGDVSTITAVGGTLLLASGSQIVNNATDQITGNFSPITWSFAKGVGLTQIGVGTQMTAITSFFVNAATSTSKVRQSALRQSFRGRVGDVDWDAFNRIFR
jgi:hypothetical protein